MIAGGNLATSLVIKVNIMKFFFIIKKIIKENLPIPSNLILHYPALGIFKINIYYIHD